MFGQVGRNRQTFQPGLYKIDLTIFGRSIPPLCVSVALGLEEKPGGIHFGPWREDITWPFYPGNTVKVPKEDDKAKAGESSNQQRIQGYSCA
jgi:hypothetical protein